MGTDVNNVVTKANSLIQANYFLTTTEQKIVLFLVSKIRKTDQEFKMYELPIKNFCELIGMGGTPKYSEIRRITRGLMKKVLDIRITPSRWIQLQWVVKVDCDEKKGSIAFAFHPDLKSYLLELKKEFTSYKLLNILELKSGHSIRIFELLKQWERLNEIEFDIHTLKEHLGIADKYKEYSNFKKKVLLVAQKELKAKTDIDFDFEEIKEGRKVVKIKFIIHRQVVSKGKAQHLNFFKELDNEDSPLYEKLNDMTNKYHYSVDQKKVERWEKIAQEKWGEEYFNKLLWLVDEVNHMEDINNPIGFVTHILKSEKDAPDSKKVIRKELLPSWLEERKKRKVDRKEQLNKNDEAKGASEEDVKKLIERFQKKEQPS